MINLQNDINNAKSLDEVCDLLNSFEINENDDQDRLDHHIDLCCLPCFGSNEPKDTMEIFSYNDTHCMIQNTCSGDDWVIVERTEDFGA